MKSGTLLCLVGLGPSLQLYGAEAKWAPLLCVCLGTAVRKHHAGCQPRAGIFLCTSLHALVMCYSANLPLSVG